VSKKTKEKTMTVSITVKYRYYSLAAAQPEQGPRNYDECEQIHGPYAYVEKAMVDGYPVIYCHHENGDPAMTFGPIKVDDIGVAGERPMPRPTVYVMNYYGATIAKYEL
jgi:hypothetical protein